MNYHFLPALLFALTLDAAHLVYQTKLPASLVASDGAGNAYLLNDSTLTKLDPNGHVIYSTTVPEPGSTFGMAVDAAGNVIYVGSTNLDSLPTTPSVFQPARSPGVCISGDRAAQPYPCPDAFIVKIGPNGTLAWASYLGGLNIDQANGVAVDSTGNIYVTGFTESSDFPALNAFQPQFGGASDAFVTKISADGYRILYSSYLGGNGNDVGSGIAVDAAGNAYVVGQNQGSVGTLAGAGFATPCFATAINAFLIQVSPEGTLGFGGCLGPNSLGSQGTSVTTDAAGNIYVGGQTNNASFPVTPGAYQDLSPSAYYDFILKVAPGGSALTYSALFPGAPFGIASLAVDSTGAVYAAGGTTAALQMAGPAIQPCLGTGFLLKLNPRGSAPLYSSFADIYGFALSPNGSVILAAANVQELTALEVPADSFLTPDCVLNSASLLSHVAYGQPGISPGEIVALKGTGLGPAVPPNPIATGGILGDALGGTQVLFDGLPAPLLYVQDQQINVVAPYELAGKTSTTIQVQYQGQLTTPVTIPVSVTSAAVFENPDGTPIALNQDSSQNSQSNPISRGGFLTLYMTGAGQTWPPSVDGQVWQTIGGLAAPASAQLTTFGTFGEVTANLTLYYAGPVPTLVSGVQQWNVDIPASLPASFVTPQFGPASVVTLQIGAQQVGVLVYVQ